MAISTRPTPLSAASLVTALVLTLVIAVPVGADEPERPADCLPTLATSALESGDIGTGWTVSRGQDPQPFTVEVLGVMPNGIGPGRDLIIVDTSGPAIDAVGGIWSGISGSPVVIDHDGEDHLIGAVAYGFSLGPSKIAGLTPATDLVAVANRGGVGGAGAEADVVRLDTQTRRAIAAETGVAVAQVGPSMSRLPVPLALSTHPARGPKLTEHLRARLPNLVPYNAGGAAIGAGAADIAAGDNFAGVLSSGDFTAAGIGTTSYVCDGRAVAFGHPFLGLGATAMGGNAADALAIVSDPTFGPYKLANVLGSVGTVDQDRLGAIRAILGQAPPSVPVTSSVTELDDGTNREGQTDIHLAELLSDVALLHTVFNIDSVYDRIGGGSALVETTVTGTRDGGEPWSMEVGNRHVSSWDISFDSLFDLYFDLLEIDGNGAELVHITGVDVDVEVESTERTYQIRQVLVADQDGDYVPLPEAILQGGRDEQLRVVLRRIDRRNGKLTATPDEVTVDLTLPVPRDLHGFVVLEVMAGPGDFDEDPYECLFDPDACTADGELTFDDVLGAIEARPRNDDLVARLLEVDDWDEWDDEEVERFDESSGLTPLAEVQHRLDRVGTGSVAAEVYVEPLPTSKPAFVRGNKWRLRNTLTGGKSEVAFTFGKSSDIKLMCDWTGDGATPVVFRDGTWLAQSELVGGPAERTFKFGKAGDVPVCGDWNGNGKDGPGIVRGKTWLLRNRMSGGKAAYEFDYGKASDAKLVGDWDGDGKDTPGLRRGTQWMLRNKLTSGKATIVFDYGHAKAQPVVGDWNFDGKDTIGVVRDGDWRLRNSLSAGKSSIRFDFGRTGDTFIAWD